VASDAAVTVMFNRPVVPLLAVSDPSRSDLPPLTLTRPATAPRWRFSRWLNTSIYVFKPAQLLQAGQRYEDGWPPG
jgi:hypothetical protein